MKDGKADPKTAWAVHNEFMAIKMAAKVLQHSKDNNALVAEMSPWLQQFSLLGESGLATTYLEIALIIKTDLTNFTIISD